MIIKNDIQYHDQTPMQVINILDWANHNRFDIRLRIFCGDANTGKDWLKEYDTQGYICRSTGRIKIPLLVNNSRSYGGPALLDHCIVKITHDKKVLYQHPNYHHAELTIKPDTSYPDLNFAVYADDKLYARFETQEKAQNYIDYLEGKRNKK